MRKEKLTGDLPAEGFVDTKTLLRFLSISYSNLFEKVRAGKFPKPVKFGRKNLYPVDQVRQAFQSIARGEM